MTHYAKNLKVTAFPLSNVMAKRKSSFESQLKELEQVVERLEEGEVSLETSLKLFEKGVQLAASCQQALQQAEQKVQILTQNNEQTRLQPFQFEDDNH